jgi:hypothetical protein
MNKPHTNHTSKAFADITGIINELPIKNGHTSGLITRKPPICARRIRTELALRANNAWLRVSSAQLGLPDGLPMI